MGRNIDAFQRELDRQSERVQQRRSESSDFVWYKTRKPAKVGEKVRSRIRILPRPGENGEHAEEFWMGVDQHILTVDGQTKVFVCPDDHDRAEVATRSCPLCVLSRQLYEGRDPVHLDAARDLATRRRVFANIVDLEEGDPQAMVWGFSQTLLSGLLDICVAKRAFIDDPDDGRDLMLTCNRVGPQARDVRYSVTDLDPSPLDSEYRSAVENASDLTGLTTPASVDDLTEIAVVMDPRPSGKRSTAPVHGSSPAPAPPPLAPAPPAPTAPPSTPSDEAWHYDGPSGQIEGLSVAEVVKAIDADPEADHNLWQEGMDDWAEARTVPAIQEALEKTAAPKPPPKKGKGKPASPRAKAKAKAGPPSPPQPPGGKAF